MGRCGRRWRNSFNPVNRVGSIGLMAAYQRGTQAPMDITELGPRKRTLEKTCASLGLYEASIFDDPSQGSVPDLSMTSPDASLMDIDTDLPSFTAMPIEKSHTALSGVLPHFAAAHPSPSTGSSLPCGGTTAVHSQQTQAHGSDAMPETDESAPSASKDKQQSGSLVKADTITQSSEKLDRVRGARSKRPSYSLLQRPETLLTYAQVLFNASILFVFLYLLFNVVWTIQHDVAQKVREYELGM